MTRFNALRHGVLSRYTVLPWEDADEYRTLVAALAAEHAPQGPTEEHLVEELAGILWRKRRLRLAEAAAHRHGLEATFAPWRNTVKAALVHLDAIGQCEGVVDAIRATQADTEEDIADLDEDEAMTRRALDLLGSGRNDAYEAALAALREDTRQWWEDQLTGGPEALDEDREPYTADTAGLRGFLEGEILPRLATRRKELVESAADPRAGVRRGARPGQAGAAGALRSPPRPQARTHAVDAAPAEGTAPHGRDGRGDVIRFAKSARDEVYARDVGCW